MPASEVSIDVALVERLLAEQHPDLLGPRITIAANGWDNVVVRLGEDLAVRLPRRSMAAALVQNEATWLPRLARDLPLPIPVPLRVGEPTDEYPFNWTVVRWFPGEPAGTSKLVANTSDAVLLGRFVAALHQQAPADAPRNPYRGHPLRDRDSSTIDRLHSAGRLLERERISASAVAEAWRFAVETPVWTGPPIWLHGDLHPMNLVVRDGRFVAVIDFGDITCGDPATDLMVGWALFGAESRALFREAATTAGETVDDETWRRGRGWAISHSLAILSDTHLSGNMREMALRTLRAALSD